MILSRRVALNGENLDELYERIVIRGIEPGTPKETTQTVNRMGGVGKRVTGRYWEPLDVRVTFAIDVPKNDLITRRQIWDDVCRWARSGENGWLTVNYIQYRRLYVNQVIIEDPGDLRDWTKEFQITFRATDIPFWQDEIPTQATKDNSTGGTMSLPVNGMFRTVVDAEFVNTSGETMNIFSITANGNQISLTGIGLASGKILRLYHQNDGLLRITADGTSVYGKQSAGGANDLYVRPGTATVTVAAQKTGNLKLFCYGRYA